MDTFRLHIDQFFLQSPHSATCAAVKLSNEVFPRQYRTVLLPEPEISRPDSVFRTYAVKEGVESIAL